MISDKEIDLRQLGMEILINKYPVLAKQVFEEPQSYSMQYLKYYFNQITELTSNTIEAIIDAYAQTCFEFMSLQSRFIRTREYASSSQNTISSDIYTKPQVMDRYLLGLLATYLYWENHYKIFDYFTSHFSSALFSNSGLTVFEIGTGHGLFASYLLENVDSLDYLGIDISQSSIDFSRKLFSKVDSNQKIRFEKRDATDKNFEIGPKWKYGICCEVLEHVESPNLLLENIRKSLTRDGKLFLTTVCNLEAVDHIYLFRSPHDLHVLFERAGFLIESEINLEINGSTPDFLQSNYAAILTLR